MRYTVYHNGIAEYIGQINWCLRFIAKRMDSITSRVTVANAIDAGYSLSTYNN